MVLDAIKKRRSIRQYTAEPITDEQIRTLLAAAMQAPSANNSRPWEFVVVRDPALREELAKTHRWSGMVARAAAVFVVLGDEDRSDHWVEDTSAATQNLLVQATEMGLGTVWVAIYPHREAEQHVRHALGIPVSLRVLCLIPIGYPAAPRPAEDRYEERRVHFDRY
ncbi:MAG: nitroreductase family protein [Chloroflexota bacterium]